ncbi:hypothetical protein [Sphingomonas sp.]|jgi:hypothetical protein|uniref:hypothetical protein n=1 Tax=Sphingomonas sp. TaxID=28214 RepID=UPI002ED831FA
MNEVMSKFSLYNIFNYLVPGAALCLLIDELGLIDLDHLDVAARLVVFYVSGMAISRAGSLLIDPMLKRAGLIPRSRFTGYVRAAAVDDKVPVLLETSNTYRTMTSACMMGLMAYVLSMTMPPAWVQHSAFGCAALALTGVLFTVSYVKQNRAVTRRVRADISIETADRNRTPILNVVA